MSRADVEDSIRLAGVTFLADNLIRLTPACFKLGSRCFDDVSAVFND